MTAIGSLIMVNIDGSDPRALATFYHSLLGWEITASEDDYAMVSDGSASFGFGRIEGYEPPPWPDPAGRKQFHVDLYVDDVPTAVKEATAIGATVPDFQPGEGKWTIVLDPAGHPVCLCPRP